MAQGIVMFGTMSEDIIVRQATYFHKEKNLFWKEIYAQLSNQEAIKSSLKYQWHNPFLYVIQL